jgi:hypothetical protein
MKRIAYKNDARLAAVAVNPFNMIELVIDPESRIRSEPFENYFTGRKTTPTATRPTPLTPPTSSSRIS